MKKLKKRVEELQRREEAEVRALKAVLSKEPSKTEDEEQFVEDEGLRYARLNYLYHLCIELDDIPRALQVQKEINRLMRLCSDDDTRDRKINIEYR